MLLGEAAVQTEHLGDEQRRFVAAGTGANLEDDVLIVVRIFGDEQNTEVGVLVSSPELAEEVARLFDYWASPELSYEVTRRNGRLEWTGGFTNEPKAGFWRPLGAKLFSHLPIDSLI